MKINEMFTSNIRRTASGYALRGLTIILLLNSCISYDYKFIQVLSKKQQVTLQDYNELVDEVSTWEELSVFKKCVGNEFVSTVYQVVNNKVSRAGGAVEYASDAKILVFSMSTIDGFSESDDALFESAKVRLQAKFGSDRVVVKDSLLSGKNELRDILNNNRGQTTIICK
jgi:hypothetical protein